MGLGLLLRFRKIIIKELTIACSDPSLTLSPRVSSSEMESRNGVCWNQGEGNGALLFNGHRVSIVPDAEVLEIWLHGNMNAQ